MNKTTPPGIKNRIAKAAAATALMAIPALFAPALAFATPTPLTTPDYAIDATQLFSQTNYTNIPTINTAASNKPITDTDEDYYYNY
jgi:hypothetical protein